MTDVDIGSLYRAARGRITDLVAGLPDETCAQVVPATPAWTVHDVVAHLSGIVDDALHGRMEGAPGDEWTARQVQARRDVPVAALLAAWSERAPLVEASPTLPLPLVADVTTHEQDLRGALGRPGARDNEGIAWAFPQLVEGFVGKVTLADLPAIRVVTDAGTWGDDAAPVTLETSRFELYRAFFGRRSLPQIRSLGWSADPEPYLEHVVIFSPATVDLVE
jgi:uncharacterized protein (TIGR03083 family)